MKIKHFGMTILSLFALVAFSLSMSSCQGISGGGDNSGGSGANTNSSSILGTTWYWDDTDSSSQECTNEHYSASSGSESGSGSGGSSSSNTCENYSKNKTEISRTTKTVSEYSSTLKGTYLHIENDGTSYLGTYSYTKKIPAYTYDEVKYKITYTCNCDRLHNLSSWSYTETETENSTKSEPIYGEKTNFTPVYKGTVSTSGSTAKFNFVYQYKEIANNSSGGNLYYYTSSNPSIEESYWSVATTIGSPATTTYLYKSTGTSTEAYDLSVEKTSSYLNLIYKSGTDYCKKKTDSYGTVCNTPLSYQSWGHWDAGKYDESMIGPKDQREALYNVLKNTSWYKSSYSDDLSVGSLRGDVITFKDNLNYTLDSSVAYWGGDYYYISSTQSTYGWAASPKGYLVLSDTNTYGFYDILYQTDSSSSDKKYQLCFDGNLYPSSGDSVTAKGIGTWTSSFLKENTSSGMSWGYDEWGNIQEYETSAASEVYVSESEASKNFTYSYKPFSGKTFTQTIYSDGEKFKGNTYVNKTAFIAGKEWYVQAAVWTNSDGTKFECTGLKSSTQMQQYSLTYDSTSYSLEDVADLGSNKYIILVSNSSDDSKASFILEDKLDGTVTIVPVADENDSSKAKTLTYESRYGYNTDNYVKVTIEAAANLLSESFAKIAEANYSYYDYTASDDSLSVNLPKTTKVSSVINAFSSNTNLKKAYNLVVKASVSGDKISDTSVTVENNANIYFSSEKDSESFYATYQIEASSNETFTEPSSGVNYEYELSTDKKSLKVLVLPSTRIDSCVEDFIKNLSYGTLSYSYTSGTETKTVDYPSIWFSEKGITSDITFTVTFETYSDSGYDYGDDSGYGGEGEPGYDYGDEDSYEFYYDGVPIYYGYLSELSYFNLEEGTDYTVDESSKTVTLTESGYAKFSEYGYVY